MNRLAILEGFNGHRRKKRRHAKRRAHKSHARRSRRRGGKRKLTRQNIAFRAAVMTCWAKMRAGNVTVSPKALGSCMRKELK